MEEKYQKITVGGALIVDKKVLILRRSSKEPFLTGYYELPGGKIDFGETPQEALKREFLEETNLKIIPRKIIRVFTYLSNNGNRHTVELVYLVNLNDEIKNLKLSDEHDDIKWISIEEIDSIKMSDEIKENIKTSFNPI